MPISTIRLHPCNDHNSHETLWLQLPVVQPTGSMQKANLSRSSCLSPFHDSHCSSVKDKTPSRGHQAVCALAPVSLALFGTNSSPIHLSLAPSPSPLTSFPLFLSLLYLHSPSSSYTDFSVPRITTFSPTPGLLHMPFSQSGTRLSTHNICHPTVCSRLVSARGY